MKNVNEMTFNSEEVQICKPFSAVSNRIEYFCKRKREESDDRNNRVYYDSLSVNQPGSSRTCTTVATKRQKQSECYVKKIKVQNISGPQINGGLDPASTNSYKLSNNTNTIEPYQDVHERISNLEKCLNIPKNSYDKTDIYNKLKSIEDHVLRLENMLLNINENYSLSNLCLTDPQTSLLNIGLKNKNLSLEESNACNEVKSEDIKPSLPPVVPKKSKYTADEILDLINSIKKMDDKN